MPNPVLRKINKVIVDGMIHFNLYRASVGSLLVKRIRLEKDVNNLDEKTET